VDRLESWPTWQLVGVVLAYTAVQTREGFVITPRIVGAEIFGFFRGALGRAGGRHRQHLRGPWGALLSHHGTVPPGACGIGS
jgi:hypothetical protein